MTIKTLYKAKVELNKLLQETFRDFRVNKNVTVTIEKLTVLLNKLTALIEEAKK